MATRQMGLGTKRIGTRIGETETITARKSKPNEINDRCGSEDFDRGMTVDLIQKKVTAHGLRGF